MKITQIACILASVTAQCPCIDEPAVHPFAIEGNEGFVEIITSAGTSHEYISSYGTGTCAAHDLNTAPDCNVDDPPSWCASRWCFVDPDNCVGYPEPVASTYF